MNARLPKPTAFDSTNRARTFWGLITLLVMLGGVLGCGDQTSADPSSPVDSKEPGATDPSRVVSPVAATAPPPRIIDPKLLDNDPDRAVAHWIIGMGGEVEIDNGEDTFVEVSKIANLPKTKFKIQQLDFRNTDVTDVEFKQLDGKKVTLSKLASIMLNGTKVTDSGLVVLKKSKTTLNDLCLQDLPGVTKKSTEVIATLTNLTDLEVEGSGMDNLEALKGLTKLKNLQRLDVGKDSIGDKGVAQLKKAFPKAKIE